MSNTLKDVLNRANPNTLPDAFRVLKIGNALGNVPTFKKGAVASHVMALPEGAKAAAVVVAYATAGSSTGLKTFVVGAPAAGQVSVDLNGNIIFNSTDAVTAAEVTYVPMEGDIVEEQVSVASNVGLFAAGRTGRLILSVTVTRGTALGTKTPLARAAAPSAGQASLNLLGTGVTFAGADAVTMATIKYIAAPKQPVGDLLVAETTIG